MGRSRDAGVHWSCTPGLLIRHRGPACRCGGAGRNQAPARRRPAPRTPPVLGPLRADRPGL